MGLKVLQVQGASGLLAGLLKSDQDGIERHLPKLLFAGVSLLKSDQDGIESADLSHKLCEFHIVKIRPRWDWKERGRFPSLPEIVLKSDQDGIESHLATAARRRARELKSDQDGIERRWKKMDLLETTAVKIRPRWDWKVLRRRMEQAAELS